MKRSVCSVYFPGVITLLKQLPADEFDLSLSQGSVFLVEEEAIKIIENESVTWRATGSDNLFRPDFFIGEESPAFNNPEEFKKLLGLIRYGERVAVINRKTLETEIDIVLDLDGMSETSVNTGIGFFDHMLIQIAQHGGISLFVEAKGDLEVDEHHTVEDTAIVLGEAFFKALGSKMGISRYGFTLPMDECRSEVIIDFGGRSELVWSVNFSREKIGDMPTELFKHFFKSFASTAKCNLHISSEGENEHHKIEGIFKAFARAIKSAVKRDINEYKLPSSKGVL